METVEVRFELPSDVLSALRQDPDGFVQEMRLAAAAKWYEMALISQSKGAEIAGVSRAEFLAALARFGVSPFQVETEEMIQDVDGS